MNHQDKFDQMMGNPMQELDRILPKAKDAQSERTAESLIAFETALEPLYRAKLHKPADVSEIDKRFAMEAREAEQYRIITERIRRNGGEV